MLGSAVLGGLYKSRQRVARVGKNTNNPRVYHWPKKGRRKGGFLRRMVIPSLQRLRTRLSCCSWRRVDTSRSQRLLSDEDEDQVRSSAAAQSHESGGNSEDRSPRPIRRHKAPHTQKKRLKDQKRQIHLFLVMTVHHLFLLTGALRRLPATTAARHITRLVEVTQAVLNLPEGQVPCTSMYRPVAQRVVGQLRRISGQDVMSMLLLEDEEVEERIAKSIHIQTCIQLVLQPSCCRVPRWLSQYLVTAIVLLAVALGGSIALL